MKTKDKDENYVRRTISVPKALDKIIEKEVSKQKIHRNVNYSSIMVEFAATQLLK